MTQPDILVYTSAWHTQSSDAFLDLVVHPLRRHAQVARETWVRGTPPDGIRAATVIFCQIAPSAEWARGHGGKIVWVPMWDHVTRWPFSRWKALPKSIRVVAFSRQVETLATRVGLPTLRLQYYVDPQTFTPARWDERVMLYWNRRGMVDAAFLARLCETLRIDRLLFRPELDPKTPDAAFYTLPPMLGGAVVEALGRHERREDYFQQLRRANIFLAPRRYEGVGLSFLEALASGCVVLAHDAPTMNEYITHGEDGYLFPRIRPPIGIPFQRKIQRLLARARHEDVPPRIDRLSLRQDWDRLASLDLPALGQRARERHAEGYRRWQAQVEDYARFVLEP